MNNINNVNNVDNVNNVNNTINNHNGFVRVIDNGYVIPTNVKAFVNDRILTERKIPDMNDVMTEVLKVMKSNDFNRIPKISLDIKT